MNTSEPVASRNSWLRVAVVILLVFLLGFGLGAGGVLLGVRFMVQRAFTGAVQGNQPIDRFMARLEARMDNGLNLTPDERAMVHEELTASTAQFKQERTQFLGSVRGLIADTVYRIASRLPPDKGEKLREIARRRFAPWGVAPGQSSRAASSPTPGSP